MTKLKNKVAYITGGSQGIGLGIAQSLLDQGVNVAISGRNTDKLEAASKTLEVAPDRLLTIQSDVRRMEDEQHAVQQVLDK